MVTDTAAQTHTANAITALSNATAANRATMVALTVSIQTLITQLTSTQSQLVTALASNGTGKRTRDSRDKAPNLYGKVCHYCWACGFDCEHSSSNLSKKSALHEDHFNCFDTKGGLQANKKMTKWVTGWEL